MKIYFLSYLSSIYCSNAEEIFQIVSNSVKLVIENPLVLIVQH